MDEKYTVLVCDDDEDIRAALKIYLVQDGYEVIQAANGIEAVEAVEKQTIHLVILDVMMPEMDGIRATAKIRETSNVPILFLSAKTEDTDRILGLNMGGDDYITKPFNPVELLARVRAALRRYARLGGLENLEDSEDTAGTNREGAGSEVLATSNSQAPGEEARKKIYRTGDLILDEDRKRVTVAGEDAKLTAREYMIMRLLMTNMEHVFSSSQIYEAVWEEPAFDVSKTISVHIRHIREKIEINPKEPQYLTVLYGLGYKVVKLK